MGLLQVVFITTLCIGCCLSGDICKIFKQGTNTPWSITDMIIYVSPGDIFNATCGCTSSSSFWRAFYKNGSEELSKSTYTPAVCNTGTNTCIDIFQTITEPLIVLCSTIDFNDFTILYSLPVVINIQEPDNNCLSPSPESSYLLSSIILSPSLSFSSQPPLLPLLSSLPSLMTSNIMTSFPFPSPLTGHSSCSNLTITVTISFTTVFVTGTPTSSINAELTSYTATFSGSTDHTTSSTLKHTEVGNLPPTQPLVCTEERTTTLLTVIVTLGCILIILFILAIILLISGIVVYSNRKNKAIPDPQLQTCPAYSTREVFFIRDITNDTTDYEYVQ